MAASRGDAPRIQATQSRLLKAEWDGKPDEQQEIFGNKEALWDPELHPTLTALRSLCSWTIK